jgi:hypothetical protein
MMFVFYWAVAAVGAKRNASGLLWRRGNRPASGGDIVDRCGAAVAIASRVSRINPAICQPVQSPRVGRRRAVCAWLWIGDLRAVASRAQLGHAYVSQGAARTRHQRTLRIYSSSDLHGVDSGDARFRDWRKYFLGAAARSRRRVLHLKCSTRRIRHVAVVPGAVRRLHGTNRDAPASVDDVTQNSARTDRAACLLCSRRGAKPEYPGEESI